MHMDGVGRKTQLRLTLADDTQVDVTVTNLGWQGDRYTTKIEFTATVLSDFYALYHNDSHCIDTEERFSLDSCKIEETIHAIYKLVPINSEIL